MTSKEFPFQKSWEQIMEMISIRDKTWLKINNTKFKIKEYERVIEDSRMSILLEITLSKLPEQGIGSVHFYNELNKKRRYYDSVHFGNITRFLSHIEEEELRYRQLYVKSHESYISHPKDECYNLLLKVFENLNILYRLSDILITEIDKNSVEYNKVYNKLEDEGYFLSDVEKFQVESLVKISENLNQINNSIINLSEVLQKGLENIDSSIKEVQFETYYVGEKIGDIEMRLWDM
jgi:hypothetical protein